MKHRLRRREVPGSRFAGRVPKVRRVFQLEKFVAERGGENRHARAGADGEFGPPRGDDP